MTVDKVYTDVNGGIHAGLNAGTFQSDPRNDTACNFAYLPRGVFCGCVAIDEDNVYARNNPFSKSQTVRIKVCDYNGFRTRRSSTKKCHNANWTRAANKERVS